MKIAVFVLAFVIGNVWSESCSNQNDCVNTGCSTGNDLHCVDSNCLCLSPATGASCHDDDDCEHADHNHEHCYNDDNLVWKCQSHNCHCVKD